MIDKAVDERVAAMESRFDQKLEKLEGKVGDQEEGAQASIEALETEVAALQVSNMMILCL